MFDKKGFRKFWSLKSECNFFVIFFEVKLVMRVVENILIVVVVSEFEYLRKDDLIYVV